MRHFRPLLLVLSLAAPLAAPVAADGRAYQVADNAPNTPVRNQGGLVYPAFFQPVNGGDVFLAPAGSHPAPVTDTASIWRTDGTPEGTRPMVSGAVLGIGSLVGSNGESAYFVGSTRIDSRFSYWSTDGTANGTVLLEADLLGSHDFDTYLPSLAVVDGRLYFEDCKPFPATACDLWTSDGSLTGTRKLVTLERGMTRPVGSAGITYFFVLSADYSEYRLWRTDGTPVGTRQLGAFDNQRAPTLASVRGQALVQAEGKLWVTSASGLTAVATLGEQEILFLDSPYSVVEGDVLYFQAMRTDGGGSRLFVWRSDGTASGTAQVLSEPLANSPNPVHPWVQRHGSRVYFLLPGPLGREPYSLWSSDLEGHGAQPVGCGGCASVAGSGWIVAAGDDLFFPAVQGDAVALWAIDSANVARVVAPLCTGAGSCEMNEAVAVGDDVVFAFSSGAGRQVWASDGSAAGTSSLASFATFHGPLYASTSLDGVLYPAATDAFRQTSLWMSRAAPRSTVELSAVPGEGSMPRQLRRAGARIAFVGCREPAGIWGAGPLGAELLQELSYVDCSSDRGLESFVSAGQSAFFEHAQYLGQSAVWATEGTAASTRRIWDNGDGSGLKASDLVAFGDRIAFWLSGEIGGQLQSSLWRSDGTAAGTAKAFDLPLGTGPGIRSTALGSELYFVAGSPRQVWRTDGTTRGTRRLTNQPLGEFSAEEFARAGSYVYFTGERGIWRSRGTKATTVLAIPALQGDAPEQLRWLHEQGGALLFARIKKGVSTLWRTEGTLASTQQIAALTLDSRSPRAVSFGGLLYFAADDGVHGTELWRTDGTAGGTVLVRDIGPGAIASNPRELVVAGGRLYFTADTVSGGSELWVSDGSGVATAMVQDIAPDAASSSPGDLVVAGEHLYFSADDTATGREPWALPLRAEPSVCTAGDTRLCLGGGRFQVEIGWQDFAGNSGPGHGVALSGDTGYFWFFDAANVELVVKVLDGRGTNGHHWVFYGALSNVEYVVTVTDTQTGEVRTYLNPAGRLASVGDTSAFPLTADAATAVDESALAVASVAAPAGVASCAPSSSRLCLQGGRFAVEASWKDFAGQTGTGTAVPITADTGYFWFFDPANVEVVTKVLDGRSLNDRFWVFYGALSNVEYTLTVTDTITGARKLYHNPIGHFGSVGDTGAF